MVLDVHIFCIRENLVCEICVVSQNRKSPAIVRFIQPLGAVEIFLVTVIQIHLIGRLSPAFFGKVINRLLRHGSPFIAIFLMNELGVIFSVINLTGEP